MQSKPFFFLLPARVIAQSAPVAFPPDSVARSLTARFHFSLSAPKAHPKKEQSLQARKYRLMWYICVELRFETPESLFRVVMRFPEFSSATQTFVLSLALAIFCATYLVGLAAQFGGRRFGKAHHVLYFFVVVSAALAAVVAFHPALLLTLAALAYLPKTRPGSWRHPFVASVAALGYALKFLL